MKLPVKKTETWMGLVGIVLVVFAVAGAIIAEKTPTAPEGGAVREPGLLSVLPHQPEMADTRTVPVLVDPYLETLLQRALQEALSDAVLKAQTLRGSMMASANEGGPELVEQMHALLITLQSPVRGTAAYDEVITALIEDFVINKTHMDKTITALTAEFMRDLDRRYALVLARAGVDMEMLPDVTEMGGMPVMPGSTDIGGAFSGYGLYVKQLNTTTMQVEGFFTATAIIPLGPFWPVETVVSLAAIHCIEQWRDVEDASLIEWQNSFGAWVDGICLGTPERPGYLEVLQYMALRRHVALKHALADAIKGETT